MTSINDSQPQKKQDNTIYGKVPPNATDLERNILGSILLEPQLFDIVSEVINSECLYQEKNQKIFEAMRRVKANSVTIETMSVISELKKSSELESIGGPFEIMTLTKEVVNTSNTEAYSFIILQKYLQRELIRISGNLINDAYEDSANVLDLLDKAENAINKLAMRTVKKDFKKLSDGVTELADKIEFLKRQTHSVTGVPSRYKSLDSITHGWQPTDLIIIAARPSVGKTAFTLNLARNAANNEIKKIAVAIFSLEMSFNQLVARFTSMESELNLDNILTGRVPEYETRRLYDSFDRFDGYEIYVDDTPALSISELRPKARRLVSKYRVGMIIIDYLQLMTGEIRAGNREQEISKISRDLKKLAKELNIPIIALSQLSRAIETRSDKVPQLSDLRESGAIEQDADLVAFLYRPSEGEILQNSDLANKGMLKIAKHRNGSLSNFAFEVNNNIQRWDEIGFL